MSCSVQADQSVERCVSRNLISRGAQCNSSDASKQSLLPRPYNTSSTMQLPRDQPPACFSEARNGVNHGTPSCNHGKKYHILLRRFALSISGPTCKVLRKSLAKLCRVFIWALPLGLFGSGGFFRQGGFGGLGRWRFGFWLFCWCLAWRVSPAWPRALAVRSGSGLPVRLLWRFLSGMGCGF